MKFGARYYDPTTGTWTQQDTLNAPLDPSNANRYLYAAGDPVNAQDPRGREFDACAQAGILFGVILGPELGAGGVAFGTGLGIYDGIYPEDCALAPDSTSDDDLNNAPDFGTAVSP